jgi:hypothetical protein
LSARASSCVRWPRGPKRTHASLRGTVTRNCRIGDSCFARIRKFETFRKPRSSNNRCACACLDRGASGEAGPSPPPKSLERRTVDRTRDHCQKRTPRPQGRDPSPLRLRECEETQPNRLRLMDPQRLQFTRPSVGTRARARGLAGATDLGRRPDLGRQARSSTS